MQHCFKYLQVYLFFFLWVY